MNNLAKLRLNTIIGLINQLVVVVTGLILPRFILLYFGSDIFGLTNSIKQFLSIITFLELGIGAVVQSALYRPIARKDNKEISNIFVSAKQFFNNLAKILIVYVIGLMIFFPLIIDSSVNYFGTMFLILAMSISLLSQYYFGIVYQIFLNADQKNYMPILAQIVVLILNTVASILLIINGYSIQAVKIVAGMIFLIRPLFLKYYVNKHYQINHDSKPTKEAIPQKWNGVAQHVAYTVNNSTDTIVLSLFSTLANVSIYSVHYMVVSSVKLLITSSTGGIKSFFGDLLAKDEIDKLNQYFSYIEWGIHTAVTYLFGLTAVLLNSFILIYTQGVGDANYDVPIFGILLTLSQAVYCIRLPYNTLVFAGGHYRETQTSSIIEALINIVVSVLAVHSFGLIGVTIGTLAAMIYRTVYLIFYLSNNLTDRSITIFVKQGAIDILSFIIMLLVGNLIPLNPGSLPEWFITAIILGLVFFMILFVINIVFYKEMTMKYIRKIILRVKR